MNQENDPKATEAKNSGSLLVEYSHKVVVFCADETAAKLAVMQRHHKATIVSMVLLRPGPFLDDALEAEEWLHGLPEEEQGYDVTLTRREIELLETLAGRARPALLARHSFSESDLHNLQTTLYLARSEASGR
jgi:hypothetical protein